MDQHDYSSHYSGQSYTQYSSTSNPHSSAASYHPQYYHTSSGSEQGGYDCDASSPTDEPAASSSSRSRGASSSASGSTSTSARRREQNRLAQRALRQRRESHIRTLEDRILHTSLHTRHLASENRDLSSQLQNMTLENDTLRRTSVDGTHAATSRAAAVPAYNPYAQGAYGGGGPSTAYSGAASPYHQSPYSSASTPSSTGDPSPSSASWPYDDPALQGQYDQRYWAGQQNYSNPYAQQYGQYGDDDADEDDGEEEVIRPSHGHRRRR